MRERSLPILTENVTRILAGRRSAGIQEVGCLESDPANHSRWSPRVRELQRLDLARSRTCADSAYLFLQQRRDLERLERSERC